MEQKPPSRQPRRRRMWLVLACLCVTAAASMLYLFGDNLWRTLDPREKTVILPGEADTAIARAGEKAREAEAEAAAQERAEEAH